MGIDGRLYTGECPALLKSMFKKWVNQVGMESLLRQYCTKEKEDGMQVVMSRKHCN